mmetsp:Transcript_73021/g.201511  ORF Transcript_73021/g.201511 Transcript_73021/m.201511 type:complete len:81 (-) Transcript_73021:1643-1885(-)
MCRLEMPETVPKRWSPVLKWCGVLGAVPRSRSHACGERMVSRLWRAQVIREQAVHILRLHPRKGHKRKVLRLHPRRGHKR